jgi:hypothetical protein
MLRYGVLAHCSHFIMFNEYSSGQNLQFQWNEEEVFDFAQKIPI